MQKLKIKLRNIYVYLIYQKKKQVVNYVSIEMIKINKR